MDLKFSVLLSNACSQDATYRNYTLLIYFFKMAISTQAENVLDRQVAGAC